jgi:RNA recognition motif-containing protein
MLMYEVVNNLQVSRDAETGISRGCGFVTMRSFAEARTAVNALDGIVSHTIAFASL